MRSFRVVVLAAVCAAFLLPAAAAAKSSGDTAVGEGVRSASCVVDCPEIAFSFSASSGPSGESPSGTFWADIPGSATFTADVTCLRVSGSQAVIAGVMTGGSGDEVEVGNPFVVVVKDGGKSSKGIPKDTMSLLGWGVLDVTAEEACADPAAIIGPEMFRLVSGDIVVTDVQP